MSIWNVKRSNYCGYCGESGHEQQHCTERIRDEVARLSRKAKEDREYRLFVAETHRPKSSQTTVPGRMTFTVLEKE